MNLPEFSVKRAVTTLMVFVAAILIGIVCLSQLPVDLMPEMDVPAITVMTTYEGAGPEDVETKVTEVLEHFLSTVPELKHITSTSKEEFSMITLQFEWGTDIDTRANEVRDSVGMAKIRLPEEVDEPRVLKFDISRFPIMVYGIRADKSYPYLETILDDELINPLKRIPGVASAAAFVPLHRQVNVDLNRESLAARSLTPLDVAYAIARENKDTPAGNLKSGITDYLIRVPGEFEDVKNMNDIVIAWRNNRPITLRELGSVTDGFKEQSRYITVDSKPGAILIIQKESEANTVKVAQAVKAKMPALLERLPNDVEVVNVMDNSEDIERSIRDLTHTLAIGGALAMIVVLIFLRRVRAAFVIGLTIPFSLIVAIILIYFLGYTINMMSLFAMIIAVGMIVDNAIVVLENITRHREEGERPDEGAIYGSSEVGLAIMASTLTTICIFFPILFVKGVTKIFFTEFAVVVTVVLVSSLFSALTFTPMLSAKLMKKIKTGDGTGFFSLTERMFDALSERYARLLDWCLHNRWKVIALAVSIFILSLPILPLLGAEFMPEQDQAMLNGTIWLPVGTRVEETARVMQEVNDVLSEVIKDEELVALYSRCGTSDTGMSAAFNEEAAYIGGFGIKLVPRAERERHVTAIADAVRKKLKQKQTALGIEKFILQTGDPLGNMITGGELPVTVNIFGDDMDLTNDLAEKIKSIIDKTDGAVDANISRVTGRPELWLNVERGKASSMGLNVSDIGDAVRSAFYGKIASKYRVSGDEYDIFVRLREEDRSEQNDLLAPPIRTPRGNIVRAANLAHPSFEEGPANIEHKDQTRIVNVGANISGRSLGEVVNDVQTKLEKLDIPPGVEIIMAGQTEEKNESFFWLTLALAVGVFLVYMVMASQFESLRDPFVVMFSIPFAFTGAIWGLFFTGQHVSIIVFLGLLMLIGVVVNNAIVLVDYINILRARGLDLFQAVQQAGRTRLRPVLMTAMTTIVALLPMAFGRGQGAEVWNQMGITVLGGLLVSTLVTLVLVPTIYTIFEKRRQPEKGN